MGAVAVVGLGTMGSRVARRLLEAGYRVTVWNRSPEKTTSLAGLGASVAATPAAAAAAAETMIIMVAGPEALRAVTEGLAGVATGASDRLTVIEMSTTGPAGVTRLAAALPTATGLLDAPVLGSGREAESGSLVILAGGPPALLEAVSPLLSTLGRVIHTGPLGSGAAAKLVANMTLFGTLGALGEAISLGRALGLGADELAEVLAATPLADQAARRRQAIEAAEYPPRFALSLARKDADLISEAAAAAGTKLRLAAAARAWLTDAEAAGWGDRDYTAVLAAILGAQRHTSRRRAGRYEGLIVDLDGVVWVGGQPVAGAADAIARLRAHGTRVVFLTNDPQASREQQAGRLTAMGIPATAAEVMTSAYAVARYLATRAGRDNRGALVCGPPALRAEMARAGFRLVTRARAREAGVVVVGGHERFGYAELRAATAAIAGGAELFATGRDPVVPGSDGPLPATGAILAAIETAAGVTATVIGKPEPYIFRLACQSLPGCRRIAAVGDNLASDIAGARRAGLDAILVLTGTTAEEHLPRCAVQPDWVAASIAALSRRLCGGAERR